MSGVKLTNLKEFQDMLRRRIAVESKKTSAEIVNKCALQTLIGSGGGAGAVNTTIKATRAQIKKDLGTMYHGVKLVTLLAVKMIAKQGLNFKTKKERNMAVAAASKRIIESRVRSANFLAAGWLKAALDLGPRTRTNVSGSQRKLLHQAGRATEGKANPAIPGNLKCVCFNAAVEGSIRRKKGGDGKTLAIVQNGLNLALANQTKDMETYVVRKETEAMLRKFSDK